NVLLSRAFVQGDAEAAIARAPVVVGGRFRFHRHAGVTLENRACLADWDAGARELTLWSSTQVPGLLRETLADLLDLPAHRLRVVAPDVGGGFGVKSALYPEEVAVCALARLAGRPAKWVGDRREDLLTSTQAWDETIEAELAVHADGTISALRARVVADVGAYSIHPWTASIEVIQVISFLPGPYRVPHYRGEGWGVATNKAPTSSRTARRRASCGTAGASSSRSSGRATWRSTSASEPSSAVAAMRGVTWESASPATSS